jgi:phosphoglycolate phosphatase-like HAD superfamily hydrolase
MESVKILLLLPSASMHKIRAILFDLDNTLIDFIRMKEESCRASVKAMVASGLRMKEDQAFELLMKTYFDVGIESNRAFSEFLRSIDQFDYKILASGIKPVFLYKMSTVTKRPFSNWERATRTLLADGSIMSKSSCSKSSTIPKHYS